MAKQRNPTRMERFLHETRVTEWTEFMAECVDMMHEYTPGELGEILSDQPRQQSRTPQPRHKTEPKNAVGRPRQEPSNDQNR